jgi:hypothetical protein
VSDEWGLLARDLRGRVVEKVPEIRELEDTSDLVERGVWRVHAKTDRDFVVDIAQISGSLLQVDIGHWIGVECSADDACLERLILATLKGRIELWSMGPSQRHERRWVSVVVADEECRLPRLSIWRRTIGDVGKARLNLTVGQ